MKWIAPLPPDIRANYRNLLVGNFKKKAGGKQKKSEAHEAEMIKSKQKGHSMIMLALGMCFGYERNESFWTSKVLQTNRNFQTGEMQMQVSLILDKTVCIMLIRFQNHETNPVLLEFVLGLQSFYCPI